MRLIVVSGLAGAGKSVALNMLEDLGYYCIDNLPLGLLREVSADTLRRQGLDFDRLAIGVDSRARQTEIAEFSERIDALRSDDLDIEIIYLYADEDTILRRYSETRRKHPLSNDQRSLIDAVALDTELTQPIASKADISIDTSRLNIHQLRDIIRNRVEGSSSGELSILVQSFGFKYGLPPAVDFVFDVRCLPNPHWVPELRALTGQDAAVAEHLAAQPATHEMRDDIVRFLTRWLPDFAREDRTYITVAIGCTGGKHRSVYLAEQITEHLRRQYANVLVRHNELH
ncbi:RNase adapter RapZ [Salinisphaera hydrothermalis]|uniref:GlmZ(SRNA)-inactivating NTPase n=1 Tax=Salinisphaera hydrothermalis (strain C41B8) TaxID=1304275 RepID=A0A084IPA0_SALHC|nr:RNase adapter RapZ [Salinisphaera hydrothermalis]KEZ78534.1 glmZ(sRNA)-inactivating NTPase [Salinisphaera hydrothermalis C41B8]